MSKQNERYLLQVLSMFKKGETLAISKKGLHFNDTELRFIGEVLAAKAKGERLISTEIANRLEVTRSAISQLVQRLTTEGVIRRLPDDVDRKISYIEVTEETEALYKEDVKTCAKRVGEIVEKFGVEKFETLVTLFDEFTAVVEEGRESARSKRLKAEKPKTKKSTAKKKK